MFRLEVLQNQWLIFALFSGAVVMLGIVLLYTMLWRPRKDTGEVVTDFITFFRIIPLVVILVIILLVVYQIVHVIMYSKNPPNI